MDKILALILICILFGCCWYLWEHAYEKDPNELPAEVYLSDKPEDIEAVKKRMEEMPDWPVVVFLVFMGSTSIGVVVPFGRPFSLIVAILCCLVLIFTGNYLYVCFGVLLQAVLVPMGIVAVGQILLGGD